MARHVLFALLGCLTRGAAALSIGVRGGSCASLRAPPSKMLEAFGTRSSRMHISHLHLASHERLDPSTSDC